MNGRRIGAAAAAMACLTLAGCSSGFTSAGPTAPATPDLVTVDGRVLHLACRGAGTPTVVLLAGGRDSATNWAGLVDDLGPDTHTCTFDYPGAGDSPPIDEPMTPAIVTATLTGALAAAGEAPPYVLVGHSLAGLSVRVFVGTHPDLVAGVVLFDPTPVEMVERYPEVLDNDLGWDSAVSIEQSSAVTSWPDVPVRIFESDPGWDGPRVDDERIWHRVS